VSVVAAWWVAFPVRPTESKGAILFRFFKWLLILGVLAGGIIAAGARAKSWWEQHLAPKYLTAVVSRGRVETVVNSTGTVKPVLSVSVGAFTSGPIDKVFVDFNSVVKKDQLIALIDTRLAEAAVERDRAAVESQKADLARIEALLQQAKNNEKRARELLAISKDYLAQTDLDQYYFTRLSFEAQIELGKASIRQAEANLKNSEANLGYTKILSPVDGIVIERKVDPGQTVAASFQTPELFIIAPDMDKHMYVFASVDEADIGQIRTAQQRGQVVRFTVDAYPGDLFSGKIHQIRKNSTTTQNVVTYPVVIEAPNPDLKLLPGMTANLTFPVEAKENVLRIPAAALRFVPAPEQVRPEDKHYVESLPTTPSDSSVKSTASEKVDQSRKRHHRIIWVKDDGPLLRAVPVTLGMMENQFAELLDGGLQEADALVTGTESSVVVR
jgi:HlyD family secretion protein